MSKLISVILFCIFLNAQTIRLSAGYSIGAHLGGATDKEGNTITEFENSVSIPMKNLLAGGNGIGFDAAYVLPSDDGSSNHTMIGVRYGKSKYKGQKSEDADQAFVTALFTGGNTGYIDQDLEVTTIMPYWGMMGGEGMFKGYVTLGLTIINYEWLYTADPLLEFTTGIGGHLGIGADMQNLGGTGIGFNIEIGFQFAWSGNEQINEALKAANSDYSVYWTNHMFTARAGVIYTLDF